MFQVTLKDEIGNEIDKGIKTFNVTTLEIDKGLLKKGDYYIPITHILYIEEV